MQSTEILEKLYEVLEQRKTADADSSYTAKLYKKGRKKIAQKVGEEGLEAAMAGVLDDKEEIIYESADLIYHMMVLWSDANIKPDEIYNELARRFGISGIEEKNSRTK
jgi:phosphoribosyl-ATP pyrophosphohydrolase